MLPTPAPTPTPAKRVDSDRLQLRSRLRLRSPDFDDSSDELMVSDGFELMVRWRPRLIGFLDGPMVCHF